MTPGSPHGESVMTEEMEWDSPAKCQKVSL